MSKAPDTERVAELRLRDYLPTIQAMQESRGRSRSGVRFGDLLKEPLSQIASTIGLGERKPLKKARRSDSTARGGLGQGTMTMTPDETGPNFVRGAF